MKNIEKQSAIQLRLLGYSIKDIAEKLDVSKSSVSLWVRNVQLSDHQLAKLRIRPHTTAAIEKRRISRLNNESVKRNKIIHQAKKQITKISDKELHLIGVMLYWAEGGKTNRTVRFSNGDPEMIKIMMWFFRKICMVPESKFRGYIHIHYHLDYKNAEAYWSYITGIPLNQFFKTYRKPNISSLNKKNSLPNGVMDIYVLDVNLFLQISGWAQAIFMSY